MPDIKPKPDPRPGKGDLLELLSVLPHLCGFVLVAGIAFTLHGLISPATHGIVAPIDTQYWTAADRERFASALHLWAALAIATTVSVLILITQSLNLIYREAGRYWNGVLITIVLSFALVCYSADAGSSSSNLSFHDHKLVSFSIDRLTKPLNALVGATVGSLFAAGSALTIRVAVDGSRQTAVRAASVLRSLILVGAVTTALGMLTIGALHRLPGAGVTGSKLDITAREAAWMHVQPLLTLDPGLGREHPAAPLVSRWIVDRANVTDAEAAIIAAASIAQAKNDPDFKTWILAPRDEASRAAQAKALDGVAAATASWWGLVFATALTVVYVLGVVVIAPVAELKGAKALALATEDENGGRWDVLIRVLTALAPLLTAGLAEAVRKLLELLQPGAA
jgi:hypothetical protein